MMKKGIYGWISEEMKAIMLLSSVSSSGGSSGMLAEAFARLSEVVILEGM